MITKKNQTVDWGGMFLPPLRIDKRHPDFILTYQTVNSLPLEPAQLLASRLEHEIEEIEAQLDLRPEAPGTYAWRNAARHSRWLKSAYLKLLNSRIETLQKGGP